MPDFEDDGQYRLAHIMAGFAILADKGKQTGRWSMVCDAAASLAIELSDPSIFRECQRKTAFDTTEALLAELGGTWGAEKMDSLQDLVLEAIERKDVEGLARILKRHSVPSEAWYWRLVLWLRTIAIHVWRVSMFRLRRILGI